MDMMDSWARTDRIEATERSVTLAACATGQGSLESLEKNKLPWPVKRSADGVIERSAQGRLVPRAFCLKVRVKDKDAHKSW